MPWRDIAIDLVSGLPCLEGYSFILVVTYWFLEMVNLIPLGEYTDAFSLSKGFSREVVYFSGLLSTIISNCNPCFVSFGNSHLEL